MKEAIKSWIRRRLLRFLDTPYECYWRDRAFRAEAELRRVRSKISPRCRVGAVTVPC